MNFLQSLYCDTQYIALCLSFLHNRDDESSRYTSNYVSKRYKIDIEHRYTCL